MLKPVGSPVFCPYGFTIDLYCKWLNPAHEWGSEAAFYGRDRAEVFRDFKAAGWVLHKDNTATCPQCRNLQKEK